MWQRRSRERSSQCSERMCPRCTGRHSRWSAMPARLTSAPSQWRRHTMSSFVLRILFTGLMAFIPNENGTKVTVVLLNADHYHTSDGAAMQAHKPLLFARAGDCTGSCVTDDGDIAAFSFRDQSS